MCSKIACALLRPASLVKVIGEVGGCLSEPPKCFEVPPLSLCHPPLFQWYGLQGVSEIAHCTKLLSALCPQEEVWTVSSLCFGLCATPGGVGYLMPKQSSLKLVISRQYLLGYTYLGKIFLVKFFLLVIWLQKQVSKEALAVLFG